MDQEFKKVFESARVAPSPHVWDRIEAALAERRKKRMLLWFRWTGVAASALIFAGVIAFSQLGGGAPTSPRDAYLALNNPSSFSIPQARVSNGRQFGTPSQANPFASLVSQLDASSMNQMGGTRLPFALPEILAIHPMHLSLGEKDRQGVMRDPVSAPFSGEMQNLQPKKQKEFEFTGDEPIRSNNRRRWALGGTYSPDLSISGAAIPGSAIAKGSTKAASTDMPVPVESNHAASFTSGLRVSYGISDRVDLQTGLLYNNRKGVSDQEGTFSTANNNQQSALVETNHLYQAFEVPVALKVNLSPDRKLNPYVAGGLSGNFFYRYRAAAQAESDVVDYKQVSNVVTNRVVPSQLNLTLGTGIQYRVADKLSLNLEPGLRYGVVTTEYSFTRSHPLTAGVNAGLNLHF